MTPRSERDLPGPDGPGPDRPVPDEPGPPTAEVVSLVQEILSVVPGGCTWLLPVRAAGGQVTDFQIAATSGDTRDIYGRGAERTGSRLSDLYPTMVGGPLWQKYHETLATGTPSQLPHFRYEEKRPGIVADALFDISVHPALGGLMVWWQRVDEAHRRLEQTERLGRLGWAEFDPITGVMAWSPGMYRVFERDPSLGPPSRAEQSAALVPEDQELAEAAWQTMDSGIDSDVTVRFRLGDSIRHLRVLSQAARDADGTPLKVYAVVQDVTAREDSRTEIDRLRDRLRRRELTALAEHRLAAQLQNMIQPIPRQPFQLAGLEATVGYLPAESAARVGGDWYHAQTLPDGQVALAVGDVAGHGLGAASGMAQLRYGLVAWLSIGIRDPGALVEHLNRLCGQLQITATAVIAIYDPATRTMRWARGGHMAPLRAHAGTVAALDPPAGLLLGADESATYPVASPQLSAGDVVLFYTDGLVERRSTSTAERLGRVEQMLAIVSADPDERSLTRLQAQLNHASPDDDTCTLAVRVLP